jgi:hypothetical protein
MIEDLAYRRLLDHYYLHEVPIKQRDIARQIGMRDNEQEVLSVLDEFFVSTEDGFINPRADKIIASYQEMVAAGKRGAAKRWLTPPDALPNPHPIALPNAIPIATKNQEPRTNVVKASRLPTDFEMPVDWKQWAKSERSDLDVEMEAESFKDYWSSKGGKEACKTDWFATWRNWVRRANAPKFGQKTVSNIMAGVR